jgi:hypothetical protein
MNKHQADGITRPLLIPAPLPQDNHVHQQIEQGGCRWNQEPQEMVKEADLRILHAQRTLLGIFHTMIVSPAKDK